LHHPWLMRRIIPPISEYNQLLEADQWRKLTQP
jgi:hypothetical protein